jgi:predicted porin
MKKSLLALAVLGAFAGVASAQSSVTIYGLLDQSVAKSNGGTAINPGSPGATSAYQVQQSAGSRLGFRGSEDMGGGLSAQFQIEHRFSPDTGAAGNAASFWQGRSYVQVTAAAAGSLYMGRDYTPAFWPAVKSDPFGWDGVGQIGGEAWAGYLTPNAGQGSGVRTSNTVGFKSASFGGLTVQGAVGLSENSTTGRTNGFNVEYGGGPIYAALGYESVTNGTQNKQGVVNGAFHYDLGVVKLMAYGVQAKLGTNGSTKAKMFSLGLRAPIGPGVLKAQAYRVDPDGAANNRTKFGIGYDYSLSKRTNLYVDFGQAKSDVVGTTSNRAAAVGMKHTF